MCETGRCKYETTSGGCMIMQVTDLDRWPKDALCVEEIFDDADMKNNLECIEN